VPTRSRQDFHRQFGLDPGVRLAFRPSPAHYLRARQGGTDVCGKDWFQASRQPYLAVLVADRRVGVLRQIPAGVRTRVRAPSARARVTDDAAFD
jgi:hypothetical protein